MKIVILLFASAREAADNQSRLEWDVEDGFDTAQLRQKLAADFPRLAGTALDEASLTLALNEEYVPTGQVMTLKEGDTVALIPPISGG